MPLAADVDGDEARVMGHSEISEVVVGFDGSPNSRQAVEVAAIEAAHRRTPLRIVHVEGHRAVPPARDLQADLDSAVAAVAHRHSEVSASVSVPRGGVVETLANASRDAALLVVAARGAGHGPWPVGSTALHLMGRAQCPMLVVRGDGHRPSRAPVIVGVDGGAAANAALGFAFSEAAAHGLSLQAWYAWQHVPTALDVLDHPPFTDAAYARGALAGWLTDWRAKYPGVDVRGEIVHSAHPGRVLVGASAAASLMVVGSPSPRDWAAHLPGSTAHALMRHSRCPVAFVPE